MIIHFKELKFSQYYKFLQIFVLSVISGMPFGIMFTMCITWLTEINVPIAVITTFAVSRTPYSLKFLYAPILDTFKLPILYNLLGKRRSWMFLTTISISFILYLSSNVNPIHQISYFKFLMICIGIMAATYDIAWDAMRIEMLKDDIQSVGVATASVGYRVGAFITGGIALKLSYYFIVWNEVFKFFSYVFMISALFILTVRHKHYISDSIEYNWRFIILNPLKDFFSQQYSFLILLSIILYKVGDAMLSVIGTPFYISMGFTKDDIFTVVKVYLLFAMSIGGYIGAYICTRFGNFKGLMICGVAEMLTNLLYILIHHYPIYPVFTFAVVVENTTASMGAAALVTYISTLCNKQYTATHYALLSSAAVFANSTLTAYAGTIAEYLGWDSYFIFTTIISLPSLFILSYLNAKLYKNAV